MAVNNQTLEGYAQTTSQASVPLDANTPLSFRDWYRSRSSVISSQEYKQYNTYLIEWYQTKQKENQDFDIQLRLTYLTLLKQLQIFSNDTEIEKWYSEINLNDDREIIISIPYFARKLKDIALYYLQLREDIKNSKIEHNNVGTTKGISLHLQKILLNTFTKKQNNSVTLPNSLWANVPELSTAKDSLVVTIEELFDDHHYSDQSITLPASAYYDFTDPIFKSYFESKNLDLSATNWIYKQGNIEVTIQDIINSLELTKDVFQKYISEKKYTDIIANTNTPLVSTLIDFYNVYIDSGLNYFFWPYGAYKPEITTITRYEPIALTAAQIEYLGSSSNSIANADTIFVKTVNGIEGAWLRFKEYEETKTDMETYLEGNKTTVFKFPYPGFGLSAEDTVWSGPSVKYTPEFYYLDKNIKKIVEQEYWNLDVSLSGADLIKITDTTLPMQGAYAGEKYDLADKLRVRKISPQYTDSVAIGSIEEAWLYKMTKTDIPLTVGNNLIVWPYQRITNEAPYPTYFPTDITTVCQPKSISAVDLPFATSSNSITGADIIYKLANYTDNESQAIECAWLSGAPYRYDKLTGISQAGLNCIFTAGTNTQFIWEGPDLTNANTVFKTLQHQPDCTFLTTASSYQQHKMCTCRSVLFTPFGHPGAEFTDNNCLADFIVELENSLDNTFTLNSTNVYSASAFAYFKTNKKIGWGDGQWYSKFKQTNNNFYLKKGKAYIYSRATDPTTSDSTTFPFLVARYPYNSSNTVWIAAKKDTDNNWVSTEQPSNMLLNPGNLLLYKKIDTTSYDVLSTNTTLAQQPTAINYNSIWSTYDFVTVGDGQYGIPQDIVVSYPNVYYPLGALDSPNLSANYIQYPRVNYGNIITIDWSIIDPLGIETIIPNTFSFTFSPLTTGIYTISLVAITADRIIPNGIYYSSGTGVLLSGIYSFTDIPEITGGNYIFRTDSLTTSSYSRSVPGFVINTSLYGWNYNYGLPDKNSNGAKPYWAQGNFDYKDVVSWGASFRIVDDYNIITQPYFSEIILETGNYIEYDRKYPKSILWKQPINYKIQVNENIWSTIQFTTTAISNLEPILYNLTNQAIALPTNNISPIQLQNVVQNQPVEIYYKAINPFLWSVSAVPEINNLVYSSNNIKQLIEPLQPWTNLTNRYYPNFAIFPTLNELYSSKDKGGFFTPNNLGLSVYLNKDYTPLLSVSSAALSSYFEDTNIHVGGRGFTREDQPSPYIDTDDNNIWLKEPVVSGSIAGTVKKSITKKYQKFIPYQSTYDSNPTSQIGVILPKSRQTPWGGNQDIDWTDSNNKPQNFSGVVNVSAWSISQVLKQQQNKLLDNWSTDIFGNQYGLYKEIKNIKPSSRRNIPGELWVRKASQTVHAGKQALSAVFDSYKGINLINDLTGSGINKIDVFFDTLYIETTGAIILEDLDYNYNTDTILSITDNARALSLAIPINTSLSREVSSGDIPLIGYDYAKPGDTWFFPQEKSIIISTCYVIENTLRPELYKLDINTKQFTKIFPANEKDKNTAAVAGTFVNSLTLTYNETKNEFLFTVIKNNIYLTEYVIKYLPETQLKSITTYSPIIQQFNVTPFITHSLKLTAEVSIPFSYQVSAFNTPNQYTITDSSYDWLTVTNSGLFTGTSPVSGNFYIPFTVANTYGPIYYSLNITISS